MTRNFKEKQEAFMSARPDSRQTAKCGDHSQGAHNNRHDSVVPDRPLIAFLNSDDGTYKSAGVSGPSRRNPKLPKPLSREGSEADFEVGSEPVRKQEASAISMLPPVRRGPIGGGRKQLQQPDAAAAGEDSEDPDAGEDGLLAQIRRRRSAGNDEGISLVKRFFGIGPASPGVPSSRMIYPLSPFALTWMGFTCGFLLYTAIATPAVIAFHWLDDVCTIVPTIYFDLTLDIFFLLDILMSFHVGVIFQGHYYDDYKWVARNYLCGSFVFDVCTSIPVSFLEFSVKFACEAAASSGNSESAIDGTQVKYGQMKMINTCHWHHLYDYEIITSLLSSSI